jgi:N-acetylmuramoyl-L-alanine amidase
MKCGGGDFLATFYIDAGHGGQETGAVRVYKGKDYFEKDFNLKLAILVKGYLQTVYPAQTIYLYRDADFNGNRLIRGQDAKSKGADVFVSIHNNATGNATASGTETLYPKTFTDGWETSKNFANYMQDTIVDYMDSKGWNVVDRGITTWTNNTAELGVFQGSAPVPSCLVECAFMTNDSDMEKLLNPLFLEDMAYSIALGTVRWLNINKGLNLPEPRRFSEFIPQKSVLPLIGVGIITAILAYYFLKGGLVK